MEFEYPERHPFGLGIPASEFATRLSRFQRELQKTGEPAAEVWGSGSEPGDIAYLSNHFPPTGEVAWLHVPAKGAAVLYADSYRPDLVMVDDVRPLVQRPNPSPAGDTPNHLARMREVKSPAELALLESAATVAAIGIEAGLASVIAGATERHVAAAAIAAAISAGADECRCAVRSGRWAGACRPWPDASDEQLRTGEPVVLEMRGSCQGYRFLEARTVRIGDAAPVPELNLALRQILLEIRPEMTFTEAWEGAGRRSAEFGGTVPDVLASGIGLTQVEPPRVYPGVTGRIRSGQVVVLNVAGSGGVLRRMVAISDSGAVALGRLAT